MPAWVDKNLSQTLVEDFNEVRGISGSITIVDAAQVETTPFTILTIAGDAYTSLTDVDVYIDLNKAVNGYATIETVATIQFAVARKVDSTNYRREAYVEAAVSGTNAAGRMQKITVGKILAGETVVIQAVMSADATADIVLPYRVLYRGVVAPTVT